MKKRTFLVVDLEFCPIKTTSDMCCESEIEEEKDTKRLFFACSVPAAAALIQALNWETKPQVGEKC